MSHVLKSSDWQPSATLDKLGLRAKIYKKIRNFFEGKGVLEVETPLLCKATVTDPHLNSFQTTFELPDGSGTPLYLQTSPEYAMKRLLASGFGSIFQICKAFRNGETGKRHNPEFTLLEWYRLDFTHHDLMNEVDELLQLLLSTTRAKKISYRELFEHFFSINPHNIKVESLQAVAKNHDLVLEGHGHSRDTWLDFLMTHIIEPHLGQDQPIFVYDYPASQAALARISITKGDQVGERFEVYYKGMELANGYHELGNASEQLLRFEEANLQRQQLNLPIIPIDHRFLESLPYLPHCSGVALGLDRLISLAANTFDISDVITFPISRA